MKKIVALILSAALVFSIAVCLCGCGDEYVPEYAYGKSFVYRGGMLTDKAYTNGNSTTTREALIKSEYNTDNLDLANAAINGVPTDLTSYKGANADEFIKNIDDMVNEKYVAILGGLTFTIGSEENPTLTISGKGSDKTYSLTNTFEKEYSVMIDGMNAGHLDLEISHDVEGKTKGMLGLNLTGEETVVGYTDISIYIPNKQICNDETADKNIDENGQIVSTSVGLIYRPYLNKAE